MAFGAILGQTTSGGGGGKRVCRFTVGTSTAGWTANDCDYLCDGTDDQVEINAAIQALPYNGGEIVVLEGRYHITATIAMDRDAVKLSGNGNNTWLYREWNSDKIEGVITLTPPDGKCCVTNFRIFTPSTEYKSNNNCAILLNEGYENTITNNVCSGNNVGIQLANYTQSNTITGNTCHNNTLAGIQLINSSQNTITNNVCSVNNVGIQLAGIAQNNTITGNTCNDNAIHNNNAAYGIGIDGSNNTITGNTCNNNAAYGIGIVGSNNTITGNTCNNNGYYNIGIVGSNNTITGNTCINGTGQSSDYISAQYTILTFYESSSPPSNNLIVGNNIMGKNYADNGTNNTWANNKYN